MHRGARCRGACGVLLLPITVPNCCQVIVSHSDKVICPNYSTSIMSYLPLGKENIRSRWKK